jgi:hypothetical protein
LLIRKARATDIKPIAQRMRAFDRLECRAMGREPRKALHLGLRAGEAWTVLVGGRPEAMFGVYPASLMEGVGAPWMLATDAAYSRGREWAALAPRWVSYMVSHYRRLANMVHRDNTKAIRWLRYAGFSVAADVERVGGEPFVRFELCARPS